MTGGEQPYDDIPTCQCSCVCPREATGEWRIAWLDGPVEVLALCDGCETGLREGVSARSIKSIESTEDDAERARNAKVEHAISVERGQ